MTTQSILNHPAKTLPGPQLLHRLIDWDENSKACAIDFTSNEKRSKYSYEEVKLCVSSLASKIRMTLSRSPNDAIQDHQQHIIPLFLPQCPGLYISQLATLETGGAFCPINLDAPVERIKFVVGDVGANIIITTLTFEKMVTWEDGPQVLIIEEFPTIALHSCIDINLALLDAQATDLAYVMYTSGSSGTPKGVAVSHLAVSQSLLAHQKHIPQFRRFLQFAAPSFDVSVFEIFFPLVRGSTLVGCDRIQLLNDLPGMITSLNVDAAELTPTVAGSLLQKRANAPCLNLLLTIGEMLTRPIVEEFGGSVTRNSILYGMYGPTEAAIHCNIYPAMSSNSKPGNIGIPLDTVSNFVAVAAKNVEEAQNMEFLPIGEFGELVLGGPQLARGYLNREEQNRSAFVVFKEKFYYRTGDKARILEDGSVEIQGRISAGQVKLNGQRVELGEVEEAVFKHPGIKTVVATVVGTVLLVFVLADDEGILTRDIVKTCSRWLPKFMVPSEIHILQKFSYLASGKVDKRKLEADYKIFTQRNDNKGHDSMTAMEKTLKKLLVELLGPFPIDMRLGAAGLDSLQAIRVSSKLRNLEFNVPTLAVLKADTLRSLAKICENTMPHLPESPPQYPISQLSILPSLDAVAGDIETILPCTPLQSAMLSETTRDSKSYRNWVELAFPGIMNSSQLLAAFRVLAQKNPILRTGFVESDDKHGFLQIMWKDFPETEISEAVELLYDLDALQDSLHYPVRAQICATSSSIKLLLHIHHANYDAWTLELLLDDLNSLLLSHQLPTRPPFSTFVSAWQNGTLLPNDRTTQDYWNDHLAHLDFRALPNFYSGKRPSPNLSTYRFQTSLSTSGIELKAKELSSSAQSLFQAAYSIILGSYLGTSDVCFGTVFSGRTLPFDGIEDMAGPCLSTLPIRVDTSVSSTLRDLVHNLNSTNRKHLDYSALPLRDIKSAAGIHPRQQIFDTLLIWQQTLHNYEYRREHVLLVDSVDNLEFNLTLEVLPGTGNIELKANYQMALFPLAQIQTLLTQIECVVKKILVDDSTTLDNAFAYFPSRILSLENENPQTKLGPNTLSSTVETIAIEDPDRIAIEFAKTINPIEFDSERMTFSALNSRANQMANYLSEQAILPCGLICICLEKCVDLYVSILAVSKTGAGYLPVTPDTPAERLRHILKEARVDTVITNSFTYNLFKSIPNLNVLQVDRIDFSELSDRNLPPADKPDNISYCVFTSGSTGTPKGVLVTHGNLVSNLDALEEIYPTSTHPRLLQSCSQAFDVSVFEIFFTWRIGGCICSATKDVLFRDIEQAIRVLDVTHLSLTPTVAALINPDNVPNVQFLVTAGEAVTQKVFNSWAGRGLYQGYGPSETTNICTVNPKVSPDDSINNIGRPFKNTSVFVLQPGPNFSIVPRGGEGEFCFGGSQVFHGYMNKEQEIGKIIEHPEFGRLYRSGDFGRLMPDGSLAFTGRKDDQVKVRGQRIELTEINNVMLRSTELSDCATFVVNANNKNPTLVCFWTSKVGQMEAFRTCQPDPAGITNLYRMLESTLPDYMIPSALIPVTCLPSTPQGKVDKRLLSNEYLKLPIEYLSSASQWSQKASEHTWTDLESLIAKEISELTHTDIGDIGPRTSFFSLGIDSISAISLASKLRKSTGRQVEISDILKHSSVTRLSQRLQSQNQTLDISTKKETSGVGETFAQTFLDLTIKQFNNVGKEVSRILPCTPLQEAMLSAMEASDKNLYWNEVAFEMIGDTQKIKDCWGKMVQRHEILRTCFVSTDLPQNPYAQVILNKYDLQFTQRATSELFSLEPPYTVQIHDQADQIELVLSMHHALYDAVALEILYSEVEAYYRGQDLAPPVTFAPFLQHMMTNNVAERDFFWHEVLTGVLPSRFEHQISRDLTLKRKTTKEEPHGRVQRRLFSQPYSWIESMLKSHSTSMLAACHASWSSVLSLQLCQTDVCFGNVVSGRTAPVDGIDRLVAPCFNTIPVRLSSTHTINYLEAFRKLQNLSADSLLFQFTPLRRLQAKFSPDGSRLFDTLFILQQHSEELDPVIWKVKEDNGIMDFPLVCEVVTKKYSDLVEVILHSYTSMFSEEDGNQIMEIFEKNLQLALENPRRQILSPATKAHIVRSEGGRKPMQVESSPTTSTSQEMTWEEKSIRDIIVDFTDIPSGNIVRDMSIFRLGLDSISAVQVATRLRKQGHNVMASDILEHPTIEKLAIHLSLNTQKSKEKDIKFDFAAFEALHRTSICRSNNIDPENITAIRPCTAVQSGMIAQTLHSDGEQYVNSIWLELLPSISLSEFQRCWSAVVAEYEMLRTGFTQIEDPLHPFTMVTYRPDFLRLSYFENDEQATLQAKYATDLLLPPGSLTYTLKGSNTVVQLQMHHALYDAHSLALILSAVSETYYGKQIATEHTVTPLLDAVLQNSESNLQSKQEFWQREENKIIVNRFPDLTPLRSTSITSQIRYIFSQASTAELEQSCRTAGVTIQAAAQATWGRILAAYTGEPTTTFGMTLSGRSVHEDADKIAFPSIVTVPIRCEVSGTNIELLERTMSSNSLLYKHQFTPLISIQKWAGHPEGKIFDTLFAYQKSSEANIEHDTPWKIVKEEALVDYAVSLEVEPTGSGRTILRLTFRDDLIPVEHAELILQQYDELLLDILRNPGNSCDIAPEMGSQLLSITPANQNTLSGPVTLLHQFVERGAQLWSDKVAFEFATCLEAGKFTSQTWTYTQLDQESNKVANLLVDRGVVPGQIIGICFDKCAEASFAIIGIMKAGCAYVALDPTAPIERLKFITQDSGTQIILTAGVPGQLIKGEIHCEIFVLDESSILTKYLNTAPQLTRDVIPEDVSYCLYTSGTTGTPKGCLITHDSAIQAMYSFQILFADHWTPDSKWLQFASFHFDVSVLEQFWSWSVGICVASAPRDLIFEDIPGAIRQLGITHIDLTPSLARIVHPDEVPSLCKGVFITGGEPLKQEILDVWGEHACVYNGYGPTEATIGVTMYPRVPINGNPSNIGPQFENVGSFVLKPGTSLPVLRGGVGELCVSGKLVGKGYLNRPGLTAERFPTLEAFNKRVYRTGDLVRILHDGSFIFLGRADDQVKLRGQRLELTEINEVIKKGVTQLDQVVTLVLKHSTQQKEQLVTFFVTTSSERDLEREERLISRMRDSCKSRLPGYMIPTHFVPIQNLPLNANNKADSKQLATIYNNLDVNDLQKLSHSDQQGKEWNTKERFVLSSIAKSLQIEETAITRGSNIFELGVDSISIIGFSRSLQFSGFENAKLSLVKSNPSIEALVYALLEGTSTTMSRETSYLAASQRIAAFSQRHLVSICKALDVESSTVECIAPCTPVQYGMIYRFLESDSALYFNKFEFTLEKEVDLELLQASWHRVITNLQILRTKFIETDDGYAQVVLKPDNKKCATSYPDYNQLSKSMALRQPFGLLITSKSFGKFMSLWIFHGLYDGNSLAMILRRVVGEYQRLENINYGPRFQASLSFGPLAHVAEAQNFWTQHLKDWSFRPIPRNLEAAKHTIATGEIHNLNYFDIFRKQIGVSHQSIIQAAWISALQTITTSSVTVGMVTSGRAIDFEGAEQVIGPLFNTIPFHTILDSTITAKELILKCHEFNMKMQDFQHTPLKDIQKWSPAKPGESLFDTLFVFQRPEEGDDSFADDVWKQVDGGQEADYPLAFEATLSPDSRKLNLAIVAQGSYFSQAQAEELLAQFKSVIQEILMSNGTNTIEGIVEDVNRESKQSRSSITPEEALEHSFAWTQQSKQIRTEIATLAKVSEDTIHETSSIFELGLDSIDVIKLSSRLKKAGIEIPVSAMIRCQSISNMMGEISTKFDTGPKVLPGELLKQMIQQLTTYLEMIHNFTDVEDILPATPLQQSMVNEMIRSGYRRYFNIETFKLGAGVDMEKLKIAVQTVVHQYPILRTNFTEILDPRSPISFAQIVHTKKSDHTQDTFKTRRLAKNQTIQNFLGAFTPRATKYATKCGRLLQITFLHGEKSQYMVMAISHALYDGSSLRAIHEDISRAYRGSFVSRPAFKPFLEQIFLSTSTEAKNFWKAIVAGLPPSKLPRKDVVEPSRINRLEKRSRVSLIAVEELCKSSRITLQTVGQTCWAIVLAQLMGQLDVVFGSVLSCRDTEEAGEVMFPLMNTVAVRSVIHGTLEELLRYMQDMSDSTRQYQHFPLGTAQAYAIVSRADQTLVGDTTLFDTLFIYQGRRSTAVPTPLYESIFGTSDVEFPVCVEMEVVDDEYLTWTTACKSEAAVEAAQIIEYLETVLEIMISSPQSESIHFDSEGTSICGLPSLKTTEKKPQAQANIEEVPDEKNEWSTTEINIQKALHDLSGVPEENIKKHSTIFHLGLDSILVLKLPALLEIYGINLRVSEILKEQTVVAMAQAATRSDKLPVETIDVNSVLRNATAHVDIAPYRYELERSAGPIEELLPVTAGQLFMLRQWQFSRGALFYSTFTYTLPVRINKARLDRAWRYLLQRHEILRTGFIEIDHEFVQVVYQAPHNDVIYQSQGAAPMRRHDLAYPPINLILEEGKDVDAQLKIVIYHALYDGISLPTIIEELQILYRLENLELPTLKFRDFVAHSVSAASQNSTKERWISYLQISKPTHVEKARVDNTRTEVFRPATLISNIRKAAQLSGVSSDALLLATIAKVRLQRLKGVSLPHVVIGIYHSNRAPFGADLTTLCAPTLNLLPLIIYDPSNKTIMQIARDVQTDLQNIGSAEMSSVSLEQVFEWTGVKVDFFVNILKENGFANSEAMESETEWKGINLEYQRRSEVRTEIPNEQIEAGKGEAFIPSIDVELRYTGDGKIDMGVFAPGKMLDLKDAEGMIEDFLGFWN